MHAKVKTFRAADARIAIDAIKRDLGADAVIVSTRQVRTGLLGRPEIEVTAAIPGKEEVSTTLSGEARHRLARPTVSTTVDLPLHMVRAVRDLTERGMDERIAHDLASGLRGADGWPLVAEVGNALRSALQRRIHSAPPPWQLGGPRVRAFVGQTGVGKTTTLVKVAMRALVDSRARVGIISVDTWRVGGAMPLARYAEVMGVRLELVRSPDDMTQALRALDGCDLVLVDTAGRFEESAALVQAQLLRACAELGVVLVISAASSFRDVEATVRRHHALRPEACIITKVDEAAAPGCVFSARLSADFPLIAFTDGQRIPDDIHCADGGETLARIL